MRNEKKIEKIDERKNFFVRRQRLHTFTNVNILEGHIESFFYSKLSFKKHNKK